MGSSNLTVQICQTNLIRLTVGLKLLGGKASFTTSKFCVQVQNKHELMNSQVANDIFYSNCPRLELKLGYDTSFQSERSVRNSLI